jgi:hypothetical protein
VERSRGVVGESGGTWRRHEGGGTKGKCADKGWRREEPVGKEGAGERREKGRGEVDGVAAEVAERSVVRRGWGARRREEGTKNGRDRRKRVLGDRWKEAGERKAAEPDGRGGARRGEKERGNERVEGNGRSE